MGIIDSQQCSCDTSENINDFPFLCICIRLPLEKHFSEKKREPVWNVRFHDIRHKNLIVLLVKPYPCSL